MNEERSILSDAGLALPAIRGRQGSRTLYLTMPSNAVLNSFFPIDIEPLADRSQRSLDPVHAREIARYIESNPEDYALGAITYAVDSEGIFTEVEPGSNIGLLRLPLFAKLRSIDGQHRREGLRMAIDTVADLAGQSTALLIYVEDDLTRRRQMFSDMNNTARKVTKALNVSYDNRDPFARVAGELADKHPLLAHRVERESSRVQPGSGNIFTLASIYDAIKRLYVGPVGRVKDSSKFEESEILRTGSVLFDILLRARPELHPAASIDEIESARSASILLSSTTLRVVASAFWSAANELGAEIVDLADPFAAALERVDFRPSAPIWQETGFVSPGRATPNARSQEMRSASDGLSAHFVEYSIANWDGAHRV